MTALSVVGVVPLHRTKELPDGFFQSKIGACIGAPFLQQNLANGLELLDDSGSSHS